MNTQATTTALGLDFGTSTSLIARRAADGPARVLPLGTATRYLPSVVGLAPDGTLTVGENAETLPLGSAIRSVKTTITRRQTSITVSDHGGREVDVAVDDVIVALLAEAVRRAAGSTDIERVNPGSTPIRLGCPALWESDQRARLTRLATQAGIRVDGPPVDEPVAAGVSWVTYRYVQHADEIHGRVLIFDFGGGTLDIAVLDVVGGDRPEITVLSSVGVDEAGDSLDAAVAEQLSASVAQLGSPPVAPEWLRSVARRTKEALSTELEHRVVMGGPYRHIAPFRHTRAHLEEAFQPQLDRAMSLVDAALREAKVTEAVRRNPDDLRRLTHEELARDIDHVLLVGGMSQIPAVHEQLAKRLPEAEFHFHTGGRADEAVVSGLADTHGYDRISLQRPGFDFVLELRDSRGTTSHHRLYTAYSPLYSRWDVSSGVRQLGVEVTGPKIGLDSQTWGSGVVRAITGDGDIVPLTIDGHRADGIPVDVRRGDLTFKVYANGDILLRTTGQNIQLRVAHWPYIRGKDTGALMLKSKEHSTATWTRAPAMTPWYWQDY